MSSSHRKSRRHPTVRPVAESLESRAMLTGGAGNTFALMPTTIAEVNVANARLFTISPANFTLPHGKLFLGIDIAPPDGSTMEPAITGVIDQSGDPVPVTITTVTGASVTLRRMPEGSGGGAVIAQLDALDRQSGASNTYAVSVVGQADTTGQALMGYYLPGDANGDGLVNSTDIPIIKAAAGSTAGDARYNFDADSNRDGRVTSIDVWYAKQNNGVQTTISPVVTVNLDPTTDTGAADRITMTSPVRFTGSASPASVLYFDEVNNQVPQAGARSHPQTGQYDVTIPLAPGANTFRVTSYDSFGQVVSGQIAPVTLGPGPEASQITPVAGTASPRSTGTTTATAETPPVETRRTPLTQAQRAQLRATRRVPGGPAALARLARAARTGTR